MTCEEARPLVGAYVDDELDAASSAALSAHLGACESCRADVDGVRALRRATAGAPYHRASESLRAAVLRSMALEARAEPPAAAPTAGLEAVYRRRLRFAWSSFGIAAAAAVILGALLVLPRPEQPGAPALVATVVSAHIRSLLAAHLADVPSTDQHTVKPWFAGKLDYSPEVVDLAADGFPLIGGRLDYLQDRPVAALVYRRNKHVINLFEWPAPGVSPLTRSRDRGYNVYCWTSGGEAHYAVTDASAAEVDRFVALLGRVGSR